MKTKEYIYINNRGIEYEIDPDVLANEYVKNYPDDDKEYQKAKFVKNKVAVKNFIMELPLEALKPKFHKILTWDSTQISVEMREEEQEAEGNMELLKMTLDIQSLVKGNPDGMAMINSYLDYTNAEMHIINECISLLNEKFVMAAIRTANNHYGTKTQSIIL